MIVWLFGFACLFVDFYCELASSYRFYCVLVYCEWNEARAMHISMCIIQLVLTMVFVNQ